MGAWLGVPWRALSTSRRGHTTANRLDDDGEDVEADESVQICRWGDWAVFAAVLVDHLAKDIVDASTEEAWSWFY